MIENYDKPLLSEIEDSTKSNAFANEKYFQAFKKKSLRTLRSKKIVAKNIKTFFL